MYSKLFSAVAVTVALLAGAAAPATAATVKGLIVDKTTWDAGYDSNMLPMMLYPYMRTASQLLAESSGGYVVVLQNATNNLYYKYADLTSDSNIVQVTNFLSLQDSTAVNMAFEADSTKISPTATSSSWSLSGINLQPFGVNASTCDFEAAMLCGARVLASAYAVLSGGTGWANCATVGVADVKTCFAPPTGTGCLAALIQALSTVMGYCQTSISTVSMICTDGTDGAEALCAYVNAMKPSGVASSTVITSADADGTVSSTKGGGGSGASTVAAAGVAVAAVAIAATLLL